MYLAPFETTYIWRTNEVKQCTEFSFGDQPSLQGCDDGLVRETSQGGAGSIELALPRWEQLRWRELMVLLKNRGDLQLS